MNSNLILNVANMTQWDTGEGHVACKALSLGNSQLGVSSQHNTSMKNQCWYRYMERVTLQYFKNNTLTTLELVTTQITYNWVLCLLSVIEKSLALSFTQECGPFLKLSISNSKFIEKIMIPVHLLDRQRNLNLLGNTTTYWLPQRSEQFIFMCAAYVIEPMKNYQLED
jgi:hypothetical protein